MCRYLYLLGVVIMVLLACKTKQVNVSDKGVEVEKVKVEKNNSTELSIQSLNTIDKEDLLFHLQQAFVSKQILNLEVQYGGGCVKPHEFVLVTDGIINEFGIMKFYVLHKTHNDKCKALIIENLSFDLKKIYELESERLTGILVNEEFLLNL